MRAKNISPTIRENPILSYLILMTCMKNIFIHFVKETSMRKWCQLIYQSYILIGFGRHLSRVS